MNILLLSHTFLPQIGGRELVVHYLAKSLCDLGHNARVLGPWKSKQDKSLRFNYPLHAYPSVVGSRVGLDTYRSRLREFEYSAHVYLDKLLYGCDVIHAHTTYPAGYLASRICNGNKKLKLIITPHGVDIHTIPHLNHGMRLNPVLRPKIDFALDCADAVTSISEGMEQSITEAGVTREKIYRVPNGVDSERFSANHQIDLHSLYGIGKASRILVTVGNYHPRKGHEVILKAMPQVLEKVPAAHLIIVGRNTDKLNSLIADLNIRDSVTLTGGVAFPSPASGAKQKEDDLLAAIYSEASVYVSAGTEQGAEGLSLAVLEAMCAGLPVVATDISGNRDLVREGYNGHLVAASDVDDLSTRVIEVLSQNESRQQMADNARETVKKYDWHEIARQYVDVYQRVLRQ